MNKILWLPSWYPSEASVQNGDFIKRHGKCLSGLVEIELLYVVGIAGDKLNKSINIRKDGGSTISERIILYRRFKFSFFAKLLSFFTYLYLNINVVRNLINEKRPPDLVHVHVALRAGIVALWIKWKYDIPYVLSEHWTIYTIERLDNYSKRNFVFRRLIRRIINNASALTVVSNSLGKGIQNMVIKKPFIKIPNVVDIVAFNYEKMESKLEFVFIHVSGMKDIKNPKGIINTFAKLSVSKKNIKLIMIGDAPSSILEYAASIGLSDEQIVFKGLLEYEQVAIELRNANAFVLFSRSENLPCVIAESLCCGVPVIATNVGGISEMIDEQNGIIIPANDENALLNAMEKMLCGSSNYDRKEISEKAQALYNPTVIGCQFNTVYNEVIGERRNYK